MAPTVMVHVLTGSGRLIPYDERLRARVSASAASIVDELELGKGDIDIVLRDAANLVIPEVGLGGFSPDPNTVMVYLDVEHPDFDRTLDQELDRLLAHDLHHLARHRGARIRANAVRSADQRGAR